MTPSDAAAKYGWLVKKTSGRELIFDCRFCDPADTGGHLWMNGESGQWLCHKCGAKGALQTLGWTAGWDRISFLNFFTRYFAKMLSYRPDLQTYWTEERGLTIETIQHFHIGLVPPAMDLLASLDRPSIVFAEDMAIFSATGRYCIPYYVGGNCGTMRFRANPMISGTADPKYMAVRNPIDGDTAWLFNEDVLTSDTEKTLLLCEGETDTIMAWQLGFRAVGVPGAGNFSGGHVGKLDREKDVCIIFDSDNAGKDGAIRAAKKLAKPVKVVELPVKDLAKYLSQDSDAVRDLTRVLLSAQPKLYGDSVEHSASLASPSVELEVLQTYLSSPEIRVQFEHRLLLGLFTSKASQESAHLVASGIHIGPRVSELLDSGGFPEYARDILQSPKQTGVEHFSAMLAVLEDLAVRRRLFAELGDVRKDVSGRTSLRDVSDKIANLQSCMVDQSSRLKVIGPADFVSARREFGERRGDPLYTGIPELDRALVYGFEGGKTSVISARTQIGKSLLRANLTLRLLRAGIPVLCISPEQDLMLETDRIISMMTGISTTAMTQQRLWWDRDSARRDLAEKAIQLLDTYPYYFVPNKDISWADVVSIIRSVKAKCDLAVVFIDLFDRLRDIMQPRTKDAPTYVIKRILGEVAVMADILRVHICLLVQIHRLPKPQGVKRRVVYMRPSLDDIKDSGSFEEVVDVIMLLYREGYYDTALPDDSMEIDIAKQRNGPTPMVRLPFNKSTLWVGDPLIPEGTSGDHSVFLAGGVAGATGCAGGEEGSTAMDVKSG